jgi:crotonobetainyl-CoA:carnitine CoA-transferase CaiB-like acyl-CoA transferase
MILDDTPLAGLRIIEVSSFIAAPLGGMTLAQLGAEVIRIDPLGGAPDTTRWPLAPNGRSLYWAGLNKGKRSVTLDLRSPDGQRAVADLVASSGPDGGIVLTNAGHPWLSYEALQHARPDLIHLRITGRHDGRPAVDYTVNAGLGFPLTTGDTFAELAAAPETLANPLVGLIDQPGIGRILATGTPLAQPGTPQTPAPAPILGADTDAILRESPRGVTDDGGSLGAAKHA